MGGIKITETYLLREVHAVESVHDLGELIHGLRDSDGDGSRDAPCDAADRHHNQCHDYACQGYDLGDFGFQLGEGLCKMGKTKGREAGDRRGDDGKGASLNETKSTPCTARLVAVVMRVRHVSSGVLRHVHACGLVCWLARL